VIARDLGNGTRLLVLPSAKWKTVSVRVHLQADLDAGRTCRSLLAAVLLRGTRRFPDMTALQRRLDSLYGAALGAGTHKIADVQLTVFTLNGADPRFLADTPDLPVQAAALLAEVVRDPARAGRLLVPAYVATEKENLRRLLRSQKDSKAEYAALRLAEIMFVGEPYGRNELGAAEDLDGIDAERLSAHYEDWIRTAPLDVLVAGQVDVEAVAAACAAFARGRAGGPPRAALPPRPESGAVRTVCEEDDVRQARLAMGFRHGAVIGGAGHAAAEVTNGMLGGFPHSKLFRRVREKESMAYSVGSAYDAGTGVLTVSAGIAPGACERTAAMVREAVDELARGAFDASDVRASQAGIIRRARGAGDLPASRLVQRYVWSLFGASYAEEEWVRSISSVTGADVAAAAGRLRLDTVYCLRGKERG
jgi:predicted Zn-dependent peptidase